MKCARTACNNHGIAVTSLSDRVYCIACARKIVEEANRASYGFGSYDWKYTKEFIESERNRHYYLEYK